VRTSLSSSIFSSLLSLACSQPTLGFGQRFQLLKPVTNNAVSLPRTQQRRLKQGSVNNRQKHSGLKNKGNGMDWKAFAA